LNANQAVRADKYEPLVELQAASDVNDPGGASQTISVQYSDDTSLDLSSLGDADIEVRRYDSLGRQVGGPIPVTFLSTSSNGSATEYTAVYQMDAPGGTWDTSDSDIYRIRLNANEVSDLAGHALPTTDLGEFTVSISPYDGPIYVTSALDDGSEGTLRAAIQAANGGTGHNTILLKGDTYTLTIPGADEDSAATGDLDITRSVTIIGAGADKTVIDAAGLDRVLDIHPGVNVTIQGVTLTGGNAGDNVGGGLRIAHYNQGLSTVVLVDCHMVDNTAAHEGGGIYVGGSLTLDHSAVTGNVSGGDGGGIYHVGSLTAWNSTISGNSAAYSGGGLYCGPTSEINLTNNTIASNQAALSGFGIGGGIFLPPTSEGIDGIYGSAVNNLIADNSLAPDALGLDVSVVSSNTNLVAPTLDGSSLILSFVGSEPGLATIELTAADPAGTSATDSFTVTLTSNDAAPTALSYNGVAVDEDAPDMVVDLLSLFDDLGDGPLTYTAFSHNPALVAATVLGSDLTLAFAPNGHGTTTVTVTATNASGSSAMLPISVTVNSVNDQPTVDYPLADVAVKQDAADTLIPIAYRFSDVEDEELTLTAVSDNTTVVQASVADGQLVLSYVAGQTGVATVTVTATDSGGLIAADTLTVRVTAPTLLALARPLNTNASTDDGHDQTHSLVTSGSGVWVCSWTSGSTTLDGSDRDIVFARSVDNGLTWTDPAPISPDGDTGSREDSGGNLATDGNGNWACIWGSWGDDNLRSIKISTSSDDGITWTTPQVLQEFDDRTGSSGAYSGYTQVTTDGAGHWLVGWIANNAFDSTWDVFITRSDNNGQTWTTPVTLNPGIDPLTNDGENRALNLATDGQGVWTAVWETNVDSSEGSTRGLLISRSTDNGETWSSAQYLNTNSPTGGSYDYDPRLTSDGQGNWVAVWFSLSTLDGTIGSDRDILVARSSNGGLTWSAPSALNSYAETDTGDDVNAWVTTDGHGTWLTMWNTTETLGDTIGADRDILLSWSTDNGQTWTDAEVLEPDAVSDNGDDENPSATTDAQGNWVVAWPAWAGLGNDIDLMVTTSAESGLLQFAPVVAAPMADLTRAEDSADEELDLSNVFSDPGALTYAATSSDPTLVAASVVDSTLTLTCQPDRHGTTTVTLTATNSWGRTASDTFTFQITPANDAPLVAATIDDLIAPIGSTDIAIDVSGVLVDPDGRAVDVAGHLPSIGNNLLGTSAGAAGMLANDVVDVPALLGPLAIDRGTTPTHPLLPGSAAIDAGQADAEIDTDQRGASRPHDGDGDEIATMDIGAYEYFDPPEIHGIKFNDLNGNGLYDEGEPGLADWTIYLDLNENGQLDAGEPSVLSATDDPNTPDVDETGTYSFVGLEPGQHVIGEIPQYGWEPTVPPTFYEAGGIDFFDEQGAPWTPNILDYAVADFDMNGYPDLVSTTDDSKVVVHMNAGGVFTQSEILPVTGGSPQVADFDGDGWTDLAVRHETDSFSILCYVQGEGFVFEAEIALPTDTSAMVAGDFDRDGLADMAVWFDSTSRGMNVLKNTGIGTFGHLDFVTTSTFYFGSAIQYMVTHDIDGDGYLDLFIPNSGGPYIHWNDGSGNFVDRTTVGNTVMWDKRSVAFDDFDQDGDTDLAIGGGSNGTHPLKMAFSWNNGDRGFNSELYWFGSQSEDGRMVPAAGDYNSDGIADLLVICNAVSGITSLEMASQGDGTFSVVEQHLSGDTAPDRLYVADFDNDGKVEALGQGDRYVYLENLWPFTPFLAAGEVNTLANFGSTPLPGEIRGFVTSQNGGAALEGWRVYIDVNNDGLLQEEEPWVDSAADGSFAFENLDPLETYVVRQVLQPGWEEITPGVVESNVIELGAGEIYQNAKFVNREQTATIRGEKFEDLDGDGERDSGEYGLPDWTIYLDLDNNGVLDGADISTITDGEGKYEFQGLSPLRTYVVREQAKAGWEQTTPASLTAGTGRLTIQQNIVNGEVTEYNNEIDGIDDPTSIILSPDRLHAYAVSQGDGALTTYQRDQATGRLIQTSALFDGGTDALGTAIDGLGGARDVVLSPDGQLLFVAGQTDNGVAVFLREVNTGELRFAQFYQEGGLDAAAATIRGLDGVVCLSLSPDGEHLYAVGRTDRAVSIFSIDRTTGELTQVGLRSDGFVETDAIGDIAGYAMEHARAITVSPDGKHVYVTTESSVGRLLAFQRNATSGELTFVELLERGQQDAQGNTIEGLDGAMGIVVSPDGESVYVAGNAHSTVNHRSALVGFRRNVATGRLTYQDAYTTETESGANDAILGVNDVAIDPEGTHVYASASYNGEHTIAIFARGANGLLTFQERIDEGSTDPAGNAVSGLVGVNSLVMDPKGRFLYSTATGDSIVAMKRDAGPYVAESYAVYAGADAVINGLDFGDRNTSVLGASADGELRGVVFLDTNHNGVQDAGETGVPGQTVFWDVDGNGVYGSGDWGMETGADGSYHFANLGGQEYNIYLLTDDTLAATSPRTNEFAAERLAENELDNPLAIAHGDVNGDGRLDLITSGNELNLFLGTDTGFTGPTELTTPDFHVIEASVVLGHFTDDNGDGQYNDLDDLDLAVTDLYRYRIVVLKGNGDGTFDTAHRTPVELGLYGFPKSIAVGDFNGDLAPDLAVAEVGMDRITILLNDGAGGFSVAGSHAVQDAPYFVTAAHLDGDSHLDLAVANSRSNSVSILRGSGNGSFTTLDHVTVGSFPASLAVGNFDDDTNLDLAVTNFLSNTIQVLTNDGAGGFTAGPQLSSGYAPYACAAADVDGDMDLDLVVTNGSDEHVAVLPNLGGGVFGVADSQGVAHAAINSLSFFLVADDLNDDGVPDLAVTDGVRNGVSFLVGSTTVNASYHLVIEGTELIEGLNFGVANAEPGISVTVSDGDSVVSEAGGTDSFDVVLDSVPVSDVVITVTSEDFGEVLADRSTLTFTPETWNVAQTVTLTGVDDAIADGNQTSHVRLAVDDAASDDAYDGLEDVLVAVTTTDDETPGFSFSGQVVVSEDLTSDTFTVVLDAIPSSDVVISVVSSDPGEASVDVSSLTFTPGTWQTPQTVTVTGVDDGLADGDQNVAVRLSIDDANSDDAFDGLSDKIVPVTTSDNDVASFQIIESGGATEVGESGGTDSFEVVLGVTPLASVVLTVASEDEGEVTVNKASLTFTPENWSTPQVVTVTGVDDHVVDGDQTILIRLSVLDAASHSRFDPLSDQTLPVTTSDNDPAGFTVNEIDSETIVSEAGDSDYLIVYLNAAPLSNVVLSVQSEDLGEVIADPTTLTFTPGNFAAPQLVTVQGVDDAIADGPQVTQLVLAVIDEESDDAFDTVPTQSVSVTTTNDDPAGFALVASGGMTTVSESGTTDVLYVSLDQAPAGNVVLDVVADDSSEVSVDQDSLTFTPSDWNAPQAVLVTGVDDALTDGDQVSAVRVSVNDDLSDDAFDALPDQTALVTTTDNDIPGFTIEETSGNSVVTEDGATDQFTVVLDAAPTTPVVLAIATLDPTEVTVDSEQLTFTPANWSTPQTITLTGMDDVIVDGVRTTVVRISVVDAESDDAFDPLPNQAVSVRVGDNDLPGFTVEETGGGTTVSESGDTDSFSVVLDAAPLTNVVFDVNSLDTSEVLSDVGTLTFTPTNWNTPQVVWAQGVDDAVADGSQLADVRLSVRTADSDDAFDGLANHIVTVTNLDNEVPSFLIDETNQDTTVSESGTTDYFLVRLGVAPTADVVLSVISEIPGEVAVLTPSFTFTPDNWSLPQIAMLVGVDDLIIDGDQTTAVRISVVDAESDDVFTTVADQFLSVNTLDDDHTTILEGTPLLAPGLRQTTLDVTASTSGFLNAWIDFNANGAWEPGEQVALDAAVVSGLNQIPLDVPIDAIPGPTHARILLTGYDPQGALLPTDEGGAEYDLDILNDVYLYGDSVQPDIVHIWPGSPGITPHRVEINDVETTYDASVYDAIYYDALGGADELAVHGKASDETAAFNTTSVRVYEDTVYDVFGDGFENIYVYSGGGTDSATILGTSGNDNFYVNRTYSYLRGNSSSFLNYAKNFASVTTDVSGGSGLDRMYAYDGAGDDIFLACETQATLDYDSTTTPGVNATAIGFEETNVYAVNGGTDTATLTGSAGNDKFTARDVYGRMRGNDGAYIHYAGGFDLVTGDATSTAGTDVAILFDGPGDDRLEAGETSVQLDLDVTEGVNDFNLIANGFDQTYAYAVRGGNDTALMTGSDSADRLTSKRAYSTLKRRDGAFFNYAKGWEQTTADVSIGGGADQAFLYDDTTDDLLTADPTQATLDYDSVVSPGVDATAIGFPELYAYADEGGNDSAILSGSTGTVDKLYSQVANSYMLASDGSYYNFTRGFDSVTSTAVGDGDIAYLYGSNGNDVYSANATSASFTLNPLSGGQLVNTAIAFDQVYGYASGGGTDVANLYGTTGPDSLTADADWAILRSRGSSDYFHYVRYFDEVFADPGDDVLDNDLLDDRGTINTLDTDPGNGNVW
jgi:6-phosphogluconolactonase (cycloisomerase 2 family)